MKAFVKLKNQPPQTFLELFMMETGIIFLQGTKGNKSQNLAKKSEIKKQQQNIIMEKTHLTFTSQKENMKII